MDLSNKNIIHIKKDGIEYLQFRKLLEYSDMIKHAYVLGIDKNFRTGFAKDRENAEQEYNHAVTCYKAICNELELNYNDIIKPQQCHTNNVGIVYKKKDADNPNFTEYAKIDGLITEKRGYVLSTTNADCILLLFFDPVKKVIANIHSGWRGTLKRIAEKTVIKMEETYGCNPADIICCLCPSIRKCHFEVDRDVYELFFDEFQELNLNEIIEKKGSKWYIDTILINKVLLNNMGLKKENIIDSEICSVCNNDLVHSYRAEGKGFGLSTAIITLK